MKERIRSNFYPERKFYQSDSFEIILEILMTWYLSKGSRTHLAWLFLRAWDSKESAMSHVSEPLSDPFLCHGFFWQFACNAGSLTRQHTNLPTNCISLSCAKKKAKYIFLYVWIVANLFSWVCYVLQMKYETLKATQLYLQDVFCISPPSIWYKCIPLPPSQHATKGGSIYEYKCWLYMVKTYVDYMLWTIYGKNIDMYFPPPPVDMSQRGDVRAAVHGEREQHLPLLQLPPGLDWRHLRGGNDSRALRGGNDIIF